MNVVDELYDEIDKIFEEINLINDIKNEDNYEDVIREL